VSGIASAEVQPTWEQKTTGYQHLYWNGLLFVLITIQFGV
jgi:hypothetical protein